VADGRVRRVADQLQRELAEIVRLELKDPRAGLITVTGLDLTTDFAYAKVFVSVFGEPEAQQASLATLRRAAGFLRSQLARRISIHQTPQLRFELDESVERGSRLSALIDRAVAEDRAHPSDGADGAIPAESATADPAQAPRRRPPSR
jgi:ribosome-binding factor A